MAFLTRLFAPQRESRATMADILKAMSAGSITKTGISVTPNTALNYTAVLAGVRILAESVASLPAFVYQRNGADRSRATTHTLYPLLHDAPNRRQTAFEFFELGMSHLILWGNYYAEIERNGRGQPLALWPLRPDRMTVELALDGRRLYTYDNTPVHSERILHIAGLGGDGIVGYSLIRLAREAIGLGLATQQFGATVFGNGAVPGIVLRHPGELTDKAYNRLQESWNATHGGLENAHKAAILEEGVSIEKIGIPPEDAQFLETRRFQIEEIARILRIPPHLMAMTDKAATYASVEQFAIQFVRDAIRPWLKRWEAALALQLLDPNDRQRYYIEFLVDDLLRGDTQTRYQAYATARQWGWMSANDIRRLENMDPVAGGDAYLVPLNMIPATSARQLANAEARHSPPATRPPHTRSDQQLAHPRQRIAEIARPQLAEAAQRILNREYNDIGAAARNLLTRRGRAEFDEWLNQFATDHLPFVQKQIRGPVTATGALAADSAAHDIGADAAPDLSQFNDDYLSDRAARWIAILRAALQNAIYPPTEPAGYDPLAAVQDLLQQRKDEAADDWARDQATRIVNAFAVVAWTALGWLALRWVSFGENCDFCANLNGRTIGISSWFAQAGESIPGADGQPPLKPGSNVRHPPLHSGCDCMVIPG